MSQGKIKFEDASGYDQMMGVWSQLVGDEFLKWLAPKKGQRWLDIGCGGGLISEPMARLGASVTGIDASQKNIKVARIFSGDFAHNKASDDLNSANFLSDLLSQENSNNNQL